MFLINTGILFCTAECLKTPLDLLKVYLHESSRVYRDKLTDEQDFQAFDKIQTDTARKFYDRRGGEEESKEKRRRRGGGGGEEDVLTDEQDFQAFDKIQTDTARKFYDHQVEGGVDLVVPVQHLQQGAVQRTPGLHRQVAGLAVPAGKVAVQVHGEIPDLFPEDEAEGVVSAVRAEVRSSGLMDTRDNCWRFFIDPVRRQLKVLLLNPGGQQAARRMQEVPCGGPTAPPSTEFHEWTQRRWQVASACGFVEEVEEHRPDVKESVSKFMAFVHVSVNHTSKEYLGNERRYNYTTPKSFLEQIKLAAVLSALLCLIGDVPASGSFAPRRGDKQQPLNGKH
ncbi:hypothetical protein CRUP_030227 [Coryphaenoides rupestris]|nr:hypothetical protein CRUP_030227 [Coryphaenoides rupestris]